jgi:hypothetical protein
LSFVESEVEEQSEEVGKVRVLEEGGEKEWVREGKLMG